MRQLRCEELKQGNVVSAWPILLLGCRVCRVAGMEHHPAHWEILSGGLGDCEVVRGSQSYHVQGETGPVGGKVSKYGFHVLMTVFM